MYERLAEYYDLVYQNKNYSKEANFLIEKFNPKSILDVGCGTGNHLFIFAEKCHTDGLDISVEMLNGAREKSKNLGMPVELFNSFEQVSKSYDLTVSLFNVINHIPTVTELTTFFENCYKHSDSHFVFECWNSPAPLLDAPRTKITEFDGFSVHTSANLNALYQIVYINTEFRNEDGITTDTFNSKLILWGNYVIQDILTRVGFKIIDIVVPFTENKVTERDYKIMYICGK